MTCFTRWLFFLLGLAATAAGTQAQQQAPGAQALDSSALAQELAEAMKAAPAPAANGAKNAPGLVVKRSGVSAAAKKLAASYPANARAEAERTFGELLARYAQVEQKLGMPANELGGAVALFLVTSLQAYRGRDVQIEQFQTVATQMRAILSANASIAQAPEADKQELYEQLAILGVFLDGVHEALQKSPNAQIAANMKQAAKSYLEQFLKTDAENIDITAQGLVIKNVAVRANAKPSAPTEREDAAAHESAGNNTAAAATPGANEEASPGGARRIETVVLKQNWTMGIGGSMVLRYDPRVLFADGTYTREPNSAVTSAPSISGRWRKQGSDYLLAPESGKEEKIPAKLRTKPARAQQTLAGRYSSLSGLGGGATGTGMVAAWRHYTFAPDGTLRFDGGAGSSIDDNTGAAEGTSVVTRSKASNTGRYSLDGYTITLTFADGKTERRLFYFFPNGESPIGLGAGTYLKDKK